ncbi:hypothetical protein PR003_g14102 [Phytophthora rubi]|uniref:Uncharacterized protein n=1 Tax=Phytophthora rubi TaxID=129364 RepID=A0A6A3L4U7_9STRA|nr:hypothetical protein PR002_g14168 [Phytophthora rubi]KAE9016796.1 hypothetical protein PR001_g14558 [Phytophthora rubi]KAE9333279.1 hypothetical protein PR003_g14102 [Phytophthora rubi]
MATSLGAIAGWTCQLLTRTTPRLRPATPRLRCLYRRGSTSSKSPQLFKSTLRWILATWAQDYTEYHGRRPDIEEEEEDDGALSEGDLSDVSATSGSSKAAGLKHSSLSRAPSVQSDDRGAGAEEADDCAGSAAEDEESPDESSGKPPRAAIGLHVLAKVATSSK